MARGEMLRLADKVEAGPSTFALECAVAVVLGRPSMPPPAYTVNLDAVKTLERKEWMIDVTIDGIECVAEIRVGAADEMSLFGGIAIGDHAEPRARMAAILRALSTEPDHG